MTLRLLTSALAVGTLLAACATSPAYQEARRAGEPGFTSQQVESNRYRVSYVGREGQSAQEVRDLALRRAADLTLEQGGDWFEVAFADTNAMTESRTDIEPGGYETRTGYVQECGLLSCRTRPTTVTEYEPAEFDDRVSTRYEHTMDIVLGTGLKPRDGNAYDARQVANNLR